MAVSRPQSLPLDVALQQAVAHHQAGRLSEAEDLYRAILHAHPGQPDALHNLGVLATQVGQHAAGLPYLKAALDADPAHKQYALSYAETLLASGQATEALSVLRAGMQRGIDTAAAQDLRRMIEATLAGESAEAPSPAEIDLLIHLFNTGQHAEVEARTRALTVRYPECGVAWMLLGASLQLQRKRGLTALQRAVALLPDDAEAHHNLGNAFKELGQFDDAATNYNRALEIKPDFAEVRFNLGTVLLALGKPNDAIASFRRSLKIKPEYAEACMNLGYALHVLGHLDEAIVCLRRALEIKPNLAYAHSNLIFCLDMMPSVGLAEVEEERRRWDQAHAAPLWREPVHANDRSPTRRLRIGYVSADLREHSAARTFIGILTQYDRSQFEVYAYSNYRGKGDSFTERFRQGVTVWRDISYLTDEAVAQLIREDGIDILVDLSGHSAGNRLLVFARKPAPIQVTGWGYGSSTGMRAMDVFFTDRVLVPPEDKHYFVEEVRYQGSAWACYTLESFPEVNALPALSEGGLTFGSFNRLSKVSEQAYGAWAQVLLAVPGSRLLLKTSELDDAANRERVLGHFRQAGVAPERVMMQGKTAWTEHVQAYNRVDVALDPFPHGGGITTLEGLMMGVPVVTLRWPSIAGRASASIVTVLGLTDWIAETQEAYVALAVRKAADLRALGALRGGLRGIVTSVLGDQEGYVRSVEAEYRQLWQRWCASAPPQGRTSA